MGISGKITGTITNRGTISGGTVTSRGGGTNDHSRLTNRDAADQHPISAITDLQDLLDSKLDSDTALPIIDEAIKGKAKGLYYGTTSEFPDKSYWYLTSEIDDDTGQGTQASIISGPYEVGTGGGGAINVTPKFTGTKATLNGDVSGASLNSISYTPQGGISGSQTISAHSHAVNVSKDTKSVLTGITSVSSNGAHNHAVDSHEHSGSGTASVINSFSGGSMVSAGTITAVKSVTGSITGNIYGFSSSQSVLSAATVNKGILSFATATASAQNGLKISTTTATVNTGYTHTPASLNYKASDSFAFAATSKTLTTADAGAHRHTVFPSAATLSYVTGATTSSAGGVTINGTNFSFSGTEASLQPTFADQGSVSITYTPSGAVSAVSIGNHSHSYEKPVAHTHSITLTNADIAVSGTVQVANHTHTISN